MLRIDRFLYLPIFFSAAALNKKKRPKFVRSLDFNTPDDDRKPAGKKLKGYDE
jgi:hypothetical protein